MTTLVLLKVVTGVTPLDHVSIGERSSDQVWIDLCGGNPNEINSVSFELPRVIRMRNLTNYRRRGGISNADLKRWIIASGLDSPGTRLLFEATFDEDTHSVIYRYKGVLRQV